MMAFANYPFATVSAVLTYVLLGIMATRRWGGMIRPLFSHPIPATQHYMAAFDTLRGFAALFVAASHLWYFFYHATYPVQLFIPWLEFGAKGVPMFAMLSGFLIYRSVRDIQTFEDIRSYLYRRFFRIFPLYAFSVILTFLCGQFITQKYPNMPTFVYFVSDFFMLRVFSAPVFANPVAWSLYFEVQFYIAMPLFALMVPKINRLYVSLIILSIFIIGCQNDSRELLLWQYFFIGIVTSELALRPSIRSEVGAAILLVGAIWLALDIQGPRYDVFTILGLGIGNPSQYTIGLGCSFAMIMYGIPYATQVGRILNIFLFRFIGIISYSIFLLHPFYAYIIFPEFKFHLINQQSEVWKIYPTMPTWFFLLVFVPGLLIWAALCFIFIERPALEFGKRWLKSSRSVQHDATTPVKSAS